MFIHGNDSSSRGAIMSLSAGVMSLSAFSKKRLVFLLNLGALIFAQNNSASPETTSTPVVPAGLNYTLRLRCADTPGVPTDSILLKYVILGGWDHGAGREYSCNNRSAAALPKY